MPRSHRPSVQGKRYVVSSVHYLATMAGVRILESSGNAADAGVATGICINVLQPGFTHFGGVAPIIYCPASGRPVETISGLGRWPRAASIDSFREHHDGDLPAGILRTVTPASPDAWLTALARFGTMTFEQVIQPALDLTENGHPVDGQFYEFVNGGDVKASPSTAEVFNPGGDVPQIGEIFVQKDLANTFKRMIEAERRAAGDRRAGIQAARDLVYKGEIAHEIADFCQQEGGLLTYDDLAAFSVRVEPPERITYKGYDVYSCGPWCQGPTLLMVLKILEGTDLSGMGYGSADYLHTMIEALKLAFSDREAYFGDPDFVQVPMAGLLDERYAEERRGAIDPQHAAPDMPPPGNPWPFHPEPRGANGPFPTLDPDRPQPDRLSHWESDTSYLCVVDEQGNAFSATPSDVVGWSPVVPGLGFPISGRGTQTWLDASHPSGLQPWKRPRLTPNPALVLKNGAPFMPFGCPGGDAQVQGMLQVFLNIIEFGMEPQEAIEAPRVVSHSFPNSFWPHGSRPGEVAIEARVAQQVRDALRTRGHIVEDDPEWSGGVSRVCAITVDSETGTRVGGADPRSTSYAIGW
ncbi:MAG: gamma-glutamyltransferase family protein [Candidatus Poribacteria bacterium]|nr:gamma-glutamyltransferase family protein [Candidatus Poribacteria bacterium]